MQEASWAGRHDDAERWYDEAARADPLALAVTLQGALVAARRGRLETAFKRLDRLPDDRRQEPVARLFRGWLLARDRQLKAAVELLEGVLRETPSNRVAATALAYARLRAGAQDEALDLLADGPGDNLEILSWAWLELERAALQWPLPPEPDPPDPAPTPLRAPTARRWAKAAVAAAEGHWQAVARHRLLGLARRPTPPLWVRPLRVPLELLERVWPTDALGALLAVRNSRHAIPRLAFHLGAQLYEDGHHAAALPVLDQACAEMADSEEAWLPAIFRAAALVDLRRWSEAEEALAAMARRDGEEADSYVHAFAAPHWLMRRARVRLYGGDDDAAQRDLESALHGEPAIFEERLAAILAHRAAVRSDPGGVGEDSGVESID